MKKIIVASTLAVCTFLTGRTLVEAFSTPVLDMTDFICQTNNNTVVDMQVSFTQSTVHPGASIRVVHGGDVFEAALPPSHTGVITHDFTGNMPDETYRLYYVHPKVTNGVMPMGVFTPKNCESKK